MLKITKLPKKVTFPERSRNIFQASILVHLKQVVFLKLQRRYLSEILTKTSQVSI